MRDKQATAAALAALAGKYHPPAYVLALEVWSQDHEESRYVDAVAVSLFTGDVACFEIKASRGDLAHDLGENLAKSQWARARCDFFWLVEAREDLVDLGSAVVPESWGVLTMRDGKLEARRTAQRIGGTPDRDLFLGVLKRVVAGPKGDALKEVERAAFERGFAKGKTDHDYALERAEQKAARLETMLRARGRLA